MVSIKMCFKLGYVMQKKKIHVKIKTCKVADALLK